MSPRAEVTDDHPAAEGLLRVCGLFAGIGGLEIGLSDSGARPVLLCEKDEQAKTVLQHRFPGVPVHSDILELGALPPCDVVTAGFPCQDLSVAGSRAGIAGERSGLVERLFQLLERANEKPRWLVVENVPYMLGLARGAAMTYLTTRLQEIGYRWAYRVVDARAFNIPQRRLRVILVASPTEDPATVLFGRSCEPDILDSTAIDERSQAHGFYWTEGRRGLGWAVNSVPTIKSGSSIGIPSPPAIWNRPRGEEIGLPDIRDLERLQGFTPGWTEKAHRRQRYRLVGNAVCVPVARWLGSNLRTPSTTPFESQPCDTTRRWPRAAWGGPDQAAMEVRLSPWPSRPDKRTGLYDFLAHPLEPLSPKATKGFLRRAEEATGLRFPDGLLDALREHLARVDRAPAKPRIAVRTTVYPADSTAS